VIRVSNVLVAAAAMSERYGAVIRPDAS